MKKQTITENDIYKACIVLSIVGLGIIHVSHSYMQPQEVNIGDIDETWIGNSVTVQGETSDFTDAEEVSFFQINDETGSIQVVDFEEREVNETAKVSGYIDMYQGSVQIVAENLENS